MIINYPNVFDNDENLFLVRDEIRFTLLEDYNPGDSTITLDGDPNYWVILPSTGLITLTDQCSDLSLRAISFSYVKNTDTDITGMVLNVTILDNYIDVPKAKRRTNVVMNVMAEHHNQIKNALIAIENFIGVQGLVDTVPLGETMEGRINFLRKLVLSPKAYFSADRKMGLVPLSVNFTDLSFRLGTDGTTGPISYYWNFGDGTSSNISISGISSIPDVSYISIGCDVHELIETNPIGTPIVNVVEKTYCEPGIYPVTLTVTNKYGSDTIVIPDLIHARVEAPKEAVIEFSPESGQLSTSTGIRVPIGSLVSIQVPQGVDPDRTGYSYAGEKLTTGNVPIDPITSYSWRIDDDLSHSTSSYATKASYSIGGEFGIKVRVDTQFGAFRITSLPSSIDVVEKQNLWFYIYNNDNVTVTPYEFGLISETFKTGVSTYVPTKDESFLTGTNNESQQKREFRRNVGFTSLGTTSSGDGGNSLLFYAGGRSSAASPTTEQVNFVSYNGFARTFSNDVAPLYRPWNWTNFNSSTHSYFVLGTPETTIDPYTSPTNPVLTDLNLTNYTGIDTTWTIANFTNGSDDLLVNAGYGSGSNFDTDGKAEYGDFSTYRSAWKDSTGFILRNDAVGDFFRIKSFYATEGTLGSPVNNTTRLQDMPGSVKMEGELLALTTGLYFFNNSGSISAYNNISHVWETGGPGVGSASFRSLQDQNVLGYDSASNTLMAASDGDKRAYLSFDYSVNAFTKFNATDLTFSSLPPRPVGKQWIIGIQ